MRLRLFVMMLLVGLLYCCDHKNKDIARQRIVDSLRTEVQANHKLTETMSEIHVLLDSIDVERGVLRVGMVEGAIYETIASRMSHLNHYVRNAEEKIAALEKASRKNNSNSKAYEDVIKKLKGDMEVRNHELAVLKEQVATYKDENENLISTVSLQRAEIDDKLNQINAKQAEISKLQEQVSGLLAKSTFDQGEAYFARAAATEEIAKRTHFAPHKKKNSREEAIELYKLALNFGKDEAQARIAALEKKM
jgi:hypothetical protein